MAAAWLVRRLRLGRLVALLRLAAFAFVLATAFVVATATGSLPSADEVRDWGESLGAAAPAAFVPLFVGLNFLVTWPVLAGAAGLLFGTGAGTPVALMGVTGAAVAQMAVARFLAGRHAGTLLPRRMRRLEDFLERHGAVAIMESRIVPLLPFGVVNYSAGLTRVRFGAMAVGTVVGAAPKVFAYTALGGSLSDLGAPEVKVALGLLVVVAIAGILVVRRQLRTERLGAAGQAAPGT
jgi:uncharacterized membrane protein YdjX (TVP38/TMEM64 family)